MAASAREGVAPGVSIPSVMSNAADRRSLALIHAGRHRLSAERRAASAGPHPLDDMPADSLTHLLAEAAVTYAVLGARLRGHMGAGLKPPPARGASARAYRASP